MKLPNLFHFMIILYSKERIRIEMHQNDVKW